MAATPQNPPLSGLARALVQAGQLKEAEAEQLLAQAHSSKTSLIEQIISSQKAGALDIARFVADTFGYPLLDLNAFDEAHIPSDAIDRKLIATHKVIPLNKRGNANYLRQPRERLRFRSGSAPPARCFAWFSIQLLSIPR